MAKMLVIVPALAVVAAVLQYQADGESCCSQVAVSVASTAGGCSGGDCATAVCTTAACSTAACATVDCSTTTCETAACATAACCASACETKAGCPIAAAMERLPKLTYAVGEKKTCCAQEAGELAKASGSAVQYYVADKQFACESEAQAALLEATETFVAKFAQPQACPESGQVTLAGQAQSCEAAAAQTAELMRQAMDQVKVAYVVGEQKCGCPVEAAKVAQESGKQLQYVVNEEKTTCEKSARLTLARAKYKAAVEALVKAQSVATTPAPTAGT